MKRSPMPPRKAPIRTARPVGVLAQASHAKLGRSRKCKQCKQPFVPSLPGALVCGSLCAELYALALKAKAERRADRARKDAATPVRVLADRAQEVMNRYCRIRDAFQSCISCDRPSSWGGQWHASHYKSRGANSALRFHLWNLNKSCSVCNNHLSGNIGEYRPRLVVRIGARKVDALDAHERSRVYDGDYLRRLCRVFTKKTKRLAARNGIEL
jgi:hypothetical protein